MKIFFVYIDGNYVGQIRAAGHNAAETKARLARPHLEPYRVTVAGTEL